MSRSKWFTPVFVLLLAALMVTACQSSTPTATEAAATEAAATEVAEPTTGVVELPTASSGDASASGDLSFTDGFGRTVVLEKTATRIVSMAPSNTELVYGLGGGSFMVGRDEFSDYPAVAKDLPSIGGSMGKYDLEAIAALKPDLVLAGGINTIDQVEALENMGITVFYFPNPTNFDELYENILILGRMIGRENRALGVVRNLGGRVEAVQIAIEKATDKPLVYYELDATDPAK
ncbi:MAG: ABC transporter substrate-binding protein, partial [Anaerolineaceae bacterium]